MPDTHAAIRPLMLLRPLAADPAQQELLIYGDIGESWFGESVTARDIVEQLQTLPDSTTQINVRVNSYGGSVVDGIAIYNALKRHAARKVVTIDGVAMSSASLIVMAGDDVQMPATSLLMIHAPWSYAQGNAQELRDQADVLDTFATAMASAYAAKSGQAIDAATALLTDGIDHYYTAEQAVAEHFADTIVDAVPDDAAPDANAHARATGVQRLLGTASAPIRQLAIAAAARHPCALPKGYAHRAETAIDLDALRIAAQSHTRTTRAASSAPLITGDNTMPNDNTAPAPAEPAADAAAITAQVNAALRARNDDIHAVLEPYMQRDGVSALYVEALADPSTTVDGVRAKLLTILGKGTAPAGDPLHVEMGTTEAQKLRGAAEQMLLARHGVLKGEDAARARQGNPFASATLAGIAERMLINAGVNTRAMGREEIARRVLAAQTSSDFPVLLENVLHKVLIGGYTSAPFTWTRFCATGTLMDYRPHGRYHLSSFSDLKPVNEHGEYENGVLGDAAKETIVGKRKGRILEITPETIVNDDLGGLVRVAGALGQAAGRTIEKDVYALFAQNGGAGPTMSDGKPLFHATHGNIGTAAAPSVAAFDAARVAMANQMDPAGNDYLDIMPSLWLGPMSLGGTARVINRSEYDPDTPNKLQRPNMVQNLFADLIDTPRLTGTAWYVLAAAATEPVFEVAFLDGVQTPTLEQELNFRTDGIAWKAVHRYGVAAVGWRGIQKNAGA